MGWAIWDRKAGFRYWDDRKGEPMAGMREAVFGRAVRQSNSAAWGLPD
jgi:hypothetical protein